MEVNMTINTAPMSDADSKVFFEQAKQDELNGLYAQVQAEFGKEGEAGIKSTIQQMELAILNLLIDPRVSDRKALPDTLRSLSNSLYAGVSSANQTPENAITALKGAAAMTAIEPMSEFKPGAQEIVTALSHRYGVKPE